MSRKRKRRPTPNQRVKSIGEMQRAHDLLCGPVLSEVPSPAGDPADVRDMQCILMTLCWCLGHRGGAEIGRYLRAVEASLRDSGYHLLPRPPEDGGTCHGR